MCICRRVVPRPTRSDEKVLATLLFVWHLQLRDELDSKARRRGNMFNGNYFGLKRILLHPATQCSEICINTDTTTGYEIICFLQAPQTIQHTDVRPTLLNLQKAVFGYGFMHAKNVLKHLRWDSSFSRRFASFDTDIMHAHRRVCLGVLGRVGNTSD